MAVRKLKNSWWVDFRADHLRHRIRSPENSKAGAEAYEAALRQKLARGEPISKHGREPERAPFFKEFARTWLAEYVMVNSKLSEQRNRTYILNGTLIPFFGGTRIDEITARTIEQYKAHQIKEGLTNKTIKNHLSLLNRCIATAYDWLELDGAPPKIKWPKCVPTQMDFLSFDECELLLSKPVGIDYELILTAVRTGMRQGELRALQWSSIDWQNRSLAVRHSRDDRTKTLLPPKSNRIRHIPLDIDVYDMLYRRKQNTGYVFLDEKGRPFNANRLIIRLGVVRERAGLRKFGWHTLRHTFASHLAMRGVPLTAVKELMGHTDIATTMRYAHLAPSTLRTAIDMLNPKMMVNVDFGQPVGNQWHDMQREEITQKVARSNKLDFSS